MVEKERDKFKRIVKTKQSPWNELGDKENRRDMSPHSRKVKAGGNIIVDIKGSDLFETR